MGSKPEQDWVSAIVFQLVTKITKVLNSNQNISKIICLEATVEEADDRIKMHVGHEVIKGAKATTVTLSDMSILVCLLYYSIRWMKEGLCNVWNVRGWSSGKKCYPLDRLVSIIREDIPLKLPAFHSLTGSGTVCKTGTKHDKSGQNMLHWQLSQLIRWKILQLTVLTEDMIYQTKIFLVNIIKSAQSEIKTLN